MMFFTIEAQEHAQLDAAYRREDPSQNAHMSGYDAVTRALNEVWNVDPGVDATTADLAGCALDLIKAVRLHLANDDGTESSDNWDGRDDGYELAMRVQSFLERIVVLKWRRT